MGSKQNMTTNNLPDPIEKRDLIYGDDTDPDQLDTLGHRFLEEGYLPDALEAFVEGDVKKGGEKILEKAVQQGDYFLINWVHEQWPELLDRQIWMEAGQQAEENGRLTDAVKLYYAGDFNEEMNRVEQRLEDELGHELPAVVKSDTADAKEKDQLEES